MFRASQKPLQGEGFFCTSYPLVDWVVQGGWRQRLEVELPHGHAGIHSVVVEYTVYGYLLPGSSHHFLGDVAHRCTQERKKKPRHFMLRLLLQRRNLIFNFLYFEKPFTKDTKPNGCHSDDKNKDPQTNQTHDSFSFTHSCHVDLYKRKNKPFYGIMKTLSKFAIKRTRGELSDSCHTATWNFCEEHWLTQNVTFVNASAGRLRRVLLFWHRFSQKFLSHPSSQDTSHHRNYCCFTRTTVWLVLAGLLRAAESHKLLTPWHTLLYHWHTVHGQSLGNSIYYLGKTSQICLLWQYNKTPSLVLCKAFGIN